MFTASKVNCQSGHPNLRLSIGKVLTVSVSGNTLEFSKENPATSFLLRNMVFSNINEMSRGTLQTEGSAIALPLSRWLFASDKKTNSTLSAV